MSQWQLALESTATLVDYVTIDNEYLRDLAVEAIEDPSTTGFTR